MADFQVTLTDIQILALRRLAPNATTRQVLQAHVDTWLQPYVRELRDKERATVTEAYKAASESVQTQVRSLLGLA